MVQTQFITKLKNVRIDSNSQFTSINFQTLLTKNGIIHQKTYVYTPQQNGVVERKHKHLLQLARSLMMQAYLPKYFCPFLFLWLLTLSTDCQHIFLTGKHHMNCSLIKKTKLHCSKAIWLLKFCH